MQNSDHSKSQAGLSSNIARKHTGDLRTDSMVTISDTLHSYNEIHTGFSIAFCSGVRSKFLLGGGHNSERYLKRGGGG